MFILLVSPVESYQDKKNDLVYFTNTNISVYMTVADGTAHGGHKIYLDAKLTLRLNL